MIALVATHNEQVAAAAAGGVLVLLLLVLLVRAWLRRRNLARRLTAVATRLEPGSPREEARGVERLLASLERATEEGLLREAGAVEAERRLEAAVEHVPHGVVVWDDEGRVAHANSRVAGLRSDGEELIGRVLDELAAGALRGEGGTRTIEVFATPHRTLVVTATPLDDGQRALGAVAVIEDVSEVRRLRAVQRDFVANAAEELLVPMQALALLAETAAVETDAGVAARLGDRLRREAARVARLVDDLLTMARLDAGVEVAREQVPVHLVVGDAVARVREAAERREIVLEVEEAPRRLTVVGDRRQLVTAVHNLLSNAVAYSDHGGRVRVGVRADGATVAISVEDEGMGLAAGELDRIFERFYRSERARPRDGGGSGLGLAVVRTVAERHGGDVDVDSREGAGSRFTLRLPAGPRAAPGRAGRGRTAQSPAPTPVAGDADGR